jgi:hypothetical protein
VTSARVQDDAFIDRMLATTFHSDDLDRDLTVKEYLQALLHQLWRESDGFSGKRPFGNSGWDWDIGIGMIKAGLLEGTLDEDGYLVDDLPDDYFDLIHACIDRM